MEGKTRRGRDIITEDGDFRQEEESKIAEEV